MNDWRNYRELNHVSLGDCVSTIHTARDLDILGSCSTVQEDTEKNSFPHLVIAQATQESKCYFLFLVIQRYVGRCYSSLRISKRGPHGF